MVNNPLVGMTIYNKETKQRGIVQTICKGRLKNHLRIKYEDGTTRFSLRQNIQRRRPSVSKARCVIDGLSEEQFERVRKTAEMVGLPLRQTAEEMEAAGLLEVPNEDSGTN
tara:strand:+ start:446 stop:778 length:333 start_codon:yes stop_codon:yes gene_type:complete